MSINLPKLTNQQNESLASMWSGFLTQLANPECRNFQLPVLVRAENALLVNFSNVTSASKKTVRLEMNLHQAAFNIFLAILRTPIHLESAAALIEMGPKVEVFTETALATKAAYEKMVVEDKMTVRRSIFDEILKRWSVYRSERMQAIATHQAKADARREEMKKKFEEEKAKKQQTQTRKSPAPVAQQQQQQQQRIQLNNTSAINKTFQLGADPGLPPFSPPQLSQSQKQQQQVQRQQPGLDRSMSQASTNTSSASPIASQQHQQQQKPFNNENFIDSTNGKYFEAKNLLSENSSREQLLFLLKSFDNRFGTKNPDCNSFSKTRLVSLVIQHFEKEMQNRQNQQNKQPTIITVKKPAATSSSQPQNLSQVTVISSDDDDDSDIIETGSSQPLLPSSSQPQPQQQKIADPDQFITDAVLNAITNLPKNLPPLNQPKEKSKSTSPVNNNNNNNNNTTNVFDQMMMINNNNNKDDAAHQQLTETNPIHNQLRMQKGGFDFTDDYLQQDQSDKVKTTMQQPRMDTFLASNNAQIRNSLQQRQLQQQKQLHDDSKRRQRSKSPEPNRKVRIDEYLNKEPDSRNSFRYSVAATLRDNPRQTVLLAVDTRESKFEKIKSILESLSCPFDRLFVPVGDFTFFYKDPLTNFLYVIPIIIERKQSDDLEQSIQDRRYDNQRWFMRRAVAMKRVLLIEGQDQTAGASNYQKTHFQQQQQRFKFHGFNPKVQEHKNQMQVAGLSASFSTALAGFESVEDPEQDRTFRVIMTKTLEQSVEFLVQLRNTLQQLLSNCKNYIEAETVLGRTFFASGIQKRNGEQRTILFPKDQWLNAHQNFRDAVERNNVFPKMLGTLRGLPPQTATSIASLYHHPLGLFRAFRNEEQKIASGGNQNNKNNNDNDDSSYDDEDDESDDQQENDDDDILQLGNPDNNKKNNKLKKKNKKAKKPKKKAVTKKKGAAKEYNGAERILFDLVREGKARGAKTASSYSRSTSRMMFEIQQRSNPGSSKNNSSGNLAPNPTNNNKPQTYFEIIDDDDDEEDSIQMIGQTVLSPQCSQPPPPPPGGRPPPPPQQTNNSLPPFSPTLPVSVAPGKPTAAQQTLCTNILKIFTLDRY